MSTSTNVLSDRLELLPPIPSTSTITVSITPASPGTSPLGSDQTTPTNSRGSGPSAKTADHFIVPPARSSSLLEGTSIRQRPHTSGGNPTNGYSTFTSSFHRQVPPSSFPTSINSNPVNDQQGIRPPPPPYSTAATGASGMSRPTSWMSASSAGSAPSPLFEKELFDAFPNVPQAIPAGPARRLGAVSEDARMKYASAGPSSLGTAGPSASNVGRSTTLPRLR
ncbi:hypothetical protein BDN72DRAFT_848783 [Pluteus cervinus]|uniref:Uncharacterized protein n=1 Tax=Pluteus cervinus TaxID=181527 RepID=A0ACD3AAL1_9AGAR|nr:hypothetical protein BDN72DRAFT_848783 [Pluteus cervinus]